MTSKAFHLLRVTTTYKTALSLSHHHNVIPRIQVWKDTSSIHRSITSRWREFSTTNNPPLQKSGSSNLPPRPKPPPEDEIEESFLKGSGPGGQKINKTNSAVQLKHLPTGLVIKCQATRSRSQNRTIARQLLADKLDDLNRGEDSRSSVVGEFKRKKKASSAKKSRRKYRKLEGEKELVDAEVLEGGEEEAETDILLKEELPEKGIETTNKDRDSVDTVVLDRKEGHTRI
ncbi:RF-1 domain-containing protein [Xylaria arbuscula]|nr:RF-1 domain-containing protein [Xylaria arbuscula]